MKGFRSVVVFVIALIYILNRFVFSDKPKQLIIIETSDVHGTLFPYNFLQDRTENRGYLAAAHIIDSIRNIYSDDQLLYIDCGDLLQGNPLTDYYNFQDTLTPHPIIGVLNDLSLDAFIVGNHDIEQGEKVWKRCRKQSHFPWLAANVTASGNPDSIIFTPYKIFEKGGIKIGVLALTTPAIPNWLPPSTYKGMEFGDMVSSCQKWLPRVKEEADIVIGAFHSGVNPQKQKPGYPQEVPEENAAGIIAKQFNDFAVILTGHQHKFIPEKPIVVPGDSSLIIMPGSKAKVVGLIKLTYKMVDGKPVIIKKEAKNIKVKGTETPPELAAKYEGIKKTVYDDINKKIGTLTKPLSGKMTRLQDTPLMDLIHRIQLQKTDAQLSLAASFRTWLEIPAGSITRRTVFSIYPYENKLYTLKIKGKHLLEHLSRVARYYYMENDSLKIGKDVRGYNFDMVEGLNYEIIYAPGTDPVVKATTLNNGRKFNPENYYTLAVNSYRAQQLNNLYNCRVLWKSELSMRDYLEEYFKEFSPVIPSTNGNWKITIKK